MDRHYKKMQIMDWENRFAGNSGNLISSSFKTLIINVMTIKNLLTSKPKLDLWGLDSHLFVKFFYPICAKNNCKHGKHKWKITN